MFNKGIHETVLASEVADRLFSNITDLGSLDQSFLATLRALLHKRLPQNETVTLTRKALFHSVNELTTASISQCMTWFLQDVNLHPSESAHHIHIVHTVYPDAGVVMMERIKANAGVGRRFMTEYNRRDDLHIFYARKARSLFYTNASGNNTIIFTNRLELKHFHVLQMMIPKYLPSLFANNPLTEMETALLKSTGNKSAVEYEALLENFASTLDIRSEIIRGKLAGFTSSFDRMRAGELRNEIKGYESDYEHYLSMMRDIANKIQDRNYTLAGLEIAMRNHNGDSELMEYFMCNKNLTIIRVDGTTIQFVAHGYADIYDVDAFEQYVSNHNGYMYNDISYEIDETQMEMLYRAIFSDCTYMLRICAAYSADMKNGLHGLRQYSLPTESSTYFPNPHIQLHGCIGSYAGYFQEYMRKRDYVGAIDQAVVSARNLNFYDATVIGIFAGNFSRTNRKCVEAPDGRLLTPLEAITELEDAALCQDQ